MMVPLTETEDENKEQVYGRAEYHLGQNECRVPNRHSFRRICVVARASDRLGSVSIK